MKTYDPKYVPYWAERFKTGEITFFFSGVTYTAHLLSPEANRFITYFVKFEDGYFLFASNAIPQIYLPYMLTHEIRKYTKYKDQPDRCFKSLIDELKEVPNEIKELYILSRQMFFSSLVKYYKDETKEELIEYKKDISECLEHLNNISFLKL